MKPEDIIQHRKFLEEYIEPDYGLLDKLRAKRALVEMEIEVIKKQLTSYERNCKIIEYILLKEKCDLLIDALNGTQQTHIVNYIAGNSAYSKEFGDDWPLVEKEISTIDDNYETLVDLLDTEDIIPRLYSVGVINRRQREYISSEATSYKKNEALLKILRRRSLKDYRQTIQCLCQTHQNHIATLLGEGGVIVKVHAVHPELTSNIAETEIEIIRNFENIIKNKSAEELEDVNLMLEDSGIVIGVRKSRSIVLYIYCATLEELVKLKESEFFGKLQKVVRKLLTEVYTRTRSRSLSENIIPLRQIEDFVVSLPEEQYIKCLTYEYFPGTKIRAARNFNAEKEIIQRNVDIVYLNFEKGDLMKTTKTFQPNDNDEWLRVKHLHGDGRIGYVPRKHFVMDYETQRSHDATMKEDLNNVASENRVNEIPLEVLDIVLQKICMYLITTEKESFRLSDKQIVCQLESVQNCWRQRIIKRNFKKKIYRQLSGFYKHRAKQLISVKNNRRFLEYSTMKANLVKKLQICDCLTDIQTRLLNREQIATGKKKCLSKSNVRELLHFFRSFSEIREAEFIRCLLRTSHNHIARVFDEGGAFVRAEMRLWDKKNEKTSNRLLVERINDLRSKNKQRLHDVDISMSQLNENGIEILGSTLDREAVAWIWCRAQHALKKLHTLHKDKNLEETMTFVAKGDLGLNRPAVRLDRDQFKKDVVHLVPTASLRGTLDVRQPSPQNVYVVTVTKLRNHIYVLRRLHTTIKYVFLVFHHRFPFQLYKVIELNDLTNNPIDSGSNENESCICVLAFSDVWKFTIHDEQVAATKWLSVNEIFPDAMWVSSEGQVLIVGQSKQRTPTLNLYGTDAAILISIQGFPPGIRNIYHAVQTSNGNFIIAYSHSREMTLDYAISEISGDGKVILRSNCISPASSSDLLGNHLLIDSNDRVFVLGRTGYILIPSNSFINLKIDLDPYVRAFYDKQEKQLFVTCSHGTSVNVYTFSSRPETP